MSLRNMGVRAKLLGMAGLLLAFMAAIGLMSITNLGPRTVSARRCTRQRLVPIGALGEFDAAVKKTMIYALDGINGIGQADVQAELDQNMSDAKAEIKDNLDIIAAADLPEAAKVSLATIQSGIPAYQDAIDTVRDIARAGGDAEKADAAYDAALAIYAPIDEAFDQLRGRVYRPVEDARRRDRHDGRVGPDHHDRRDPPRDSPRLRARVLRRPRHRQRRQDRPADHGFDREA